MINGLAIFSAGRLAILIAGGPAFTANGGGFRRAADDGGQVLARARTLSRHRRIPSLHFSPVVSGRSTGRWALAPYQNSERMVASSRPVAVASLQNSQEYSGKGRSRLERAMNSAPTSIAARKKQEQQKTFQKNGKQKRGRRNATYFCLRSSLLSWCTPGARNEEARNFFETLYYSHTVHH